jgi:hypothetical protein
MKALPVALALSVLVAIGFALQEESAQERRGRDGEAVAARQAEMHTVTGCLQESSAQGAYILETDDSEQVTIQGSDLSQHLHQKVTITGALDRAGAIRPTKVEVVSESCNQ